MTNDVVHDQQNNKAVSPLAEHLAMHLMMLKGDGEKGLETWKKELMMPWKLK